MAAPSLESIRPCFEGVIPAVIATASTDGTPNVAYLSQVEYVDAGHVALSFQFFNKTRRNVLDHAHVELIVAHPRTGATYRLQARYLRTLDDGALFERMKAKLAGIASQTGMSGVFQLRGADIYAVSDIEALSPTVPDVEPAGGCSVAVLRQVIDSLSARTELGSLVEATLDAVCGAFDIRHAMLLMHDAPRAILYTVGSRGYGESGAGAEVALGAGVIGVAARMATPIRINHLTVEAAYVRMSSVEAASAATEIRMPGLAAPHSQMALPLTCVGSVLGVLFVESEDDLRFGWEDEDALGVIASHVAALARSLQFAAETPVAEPAAASASAVVADPASPPLRVRFFPADGSLFLDDDYLIKGVAGNILWKLLSEHSAHGRTEFNNRELRLSPDLGLPDGSENLEARLVLLSRRLVDRRACVQLEKTGRGRFRLCLQRPLQLSNQDATPRSAASFA